MAWIYGGVSLLFAACGTVMALDCLSTGGNSIGAAGLLLGALAFAALTLGEAKDDRRREREGEWE
jgi:hypothetical protein